jgi:hypothetical protein
VEEVLADLAAVMRNETKRSIAALGSMMSGGNATATMVNGRRGLGGGREKTLAIWRVDITY